MERNEELVLQERARALAQPLQEAGVAPAGGPMLVFRLGEARAAVPVSAVAHVEPLARLVAIPCVPPFVLGALSVRDQVWVVLDVRQRLGLPDAEDPPSLAVLLREPQRGAALAADEVESVRSIAEEDLAPLPPGTAAAGVARGVAPERVLVIDPAALLSDPALIVDEEVSPA